MILECVCTLREWLEFGPGLLRDGQRIDVVRLTDREPLCGEAKGGAHWFAWRPAKDAGRQVRETAASYDHFRRRERLPDLLFRHLPLTHGIGPLVISRHPTAGEANAALSAACLAYARAAAAVTP